MSSNADKPQVEIIHRRNHLKEKVVEDSAGLSKNGFIDPDAIRRAQAVIDNSQDKFTTELQSSLEDLTTIWVSLKKDGVNDPDMIEEIHRLSNHIKDMAATFGNGLMDDFGKSLRDFADHLDITNKAHVTIVQAHIDVMWVAFKRDIRDINDQEAVELKKVLAQAIEKHAPALDNPPS